MIRFSKWWYMNGGIWKHKNIRLERFKNRNRARKKATDSWDRDLSTGNLKLWVWGPECGQIADWGLGLWAEIGKIMEKSKTKEVV